MSSFTFQMYYVVFISVLVLILFAFLLVLIVKLLKKNRVITSAIVIAADLVLLSCSVLFGVTHKTYYKFNDRKILKSNITDIHEKYGEPDRSYGKYDMYYIYTDNDHIMPDHLPHYYCIRYNDEGGVVEVWDGVLPGA